MTGKLPFEVRKGGPARLRMRYVKPQDDSNAVWATWEQAVHGWVLAGPEDRNAQWMHREDIHPICLELLSTQESRRAYAREFAQPVDEPYHVTRPIDQASFENAVKAVVDHETQHGKLVDATLITRYLDIALREIGLEQTG